MPDRDDPTGEISLDELEQMDPPTAEISLDELEPVDRDPSPPPPPTPRKKPPAPGRGRARPPLPKKPIDRTLLGATAPSPEGAPTAKVAKVAVPKKKKKKKRSLPPPPPSPNGPAAAAKPKARAKPKKRAAPPKPAAPRAPPPAKPVEAAAPVAQPEIARDVPREDPPEVVEADASSEELRDLCVRELADEGDAERKGRLHYELGRIHEVDLDDPARAAEHYQSALRTVPDHAASIRGARRMLAKEKRYGALPGLFDAEIGITRDPAERAHLLYAKARVMEEHLRQAGPALHVYREALALEPGNLAILKAIERSLRRDKAWQALVQTYEQLANAVEDPALRAAWTAIRAHLVETRLSNPVEAAALYETAATADPYATASLANVKRLGAAQRRWPQLIDALKKEHGLTRDQETKLEILASIARIQEVRLGDAEAAVATLEAAAEAHPEEPSFLMSLVRLHRANGRHRPEIDALTRLAELEQDPGEKARLCHRVAHVHEQLLGDSDRALPWYQRTLRNDPAHRSAAQSLAGLHQQHERWEDAITVMESSIGALSTPQERADQHHRIGKALEQHLGRNDEAARHHASALGLDPNHHEAFEDLCALHSMAHRWRELAELYDRAVDRAANDEEAIVWLFRVGALLEDRLDDSVGALAAYARILERKPRHLGALHASQRAAGAAREYPRMVELIGAEADRTDDPARAGALRHRAAMIVASRLGDATSAIRSLQGVLKSDPTHRPSLESLALLFAETGKWAELVLIEKRRLPLLSTEADKVRLHNRIGEVQESELGQSGRAVASYRDALKLDPSYEPARTALLAALERSEAWEELSEALEERVGRLKTKRERARALTELGALLEDRMDDAKGALSAYEGALDEVPLHRPALDARERLLTEAKDWKRLTEVLEAESSALEDPYFKVQAALRAALVLSEEQGAVVPALEAFRPVFAERPDHIGALLAVEEIYSRTRDDAGLAATYGKMVHVVEDPKAKLAALQELARTRAASGGETTSVQRKILQLAPDDPAALEALAENADAGDERNVQLAMQARLASTANDPTVAAYHQSRVGEILLAEGDAVGSLAAFRAALDLDAQSITAARGLTRAARAARDPSALREAARHEELLTRDIDVALGLLLEAAALHHEAGDKPSAGVDYEKALALNPGSKAAAQGLRSALVEREDVPRVIELLTRAAHSTSDDERRCALHLSVSDLQADGMGDLPAAIAATERALSAKSASLAALGKLASYLERGGQWERAVEALDRLVPRARDEALVDAHLRLARLVEQHLDDPDRAIRSLRAALSRDDDNQEALVTLVRLERLQGRDEEALRLVKKLISVVDTDVARAEALAELAELEKTRGNGEAAATAAYNALCIQGPTGSAAIVYQALIESFPDDSSWDNYVDGLMTYLDRANASGGDVAGTYRELARVLDQAHNRPDRAIGMLREGIEACPTDPSISIALVKALQQVEQHDKALVELRRSIAINVRNPRAWRAMADSVRQLGEPSGAAVVLAPLVALREATDAEKRTVRNRKPSVAAAPPGILGESGLGQIAPGEGFKASASHLIRALADVFGKLEGFHHEEWGVSKRDRVRSGDTNAVRSFADRIGLIYGIPEYELYISASPSLSRAMVLPGSPPALLVPASMEGKKDPILAFQLARPLALLSRHLHPVDSLEPADLRRILIAVARQSDPSFAIADSDSVDPQLDEETRRVGKAIGFFSRGRIQEAASAFASEPTQDIEGWIRDIKTLADRAALLVTDDLLHALEAHGGSLGRDSAADELARFWVSDPAMRFRRAVVQTI